MDFPVSVSNTERDELKLLLSHYLQKKLNASENLKSTELFGHIRIFLPSPIISPPNVVIQNSSSNSAVSPN